MKCPVCKTEHRTMVCPECGFDSSRNYEKYPTLRPVGKSPSVSALRQAWAATPPEESTVIPPQPAPDPPKEPVIPPAPDPVRKRSPWLAIVACVLILVAGIGIGAGLGNGKLESAKPMETVQPQETTELFEIEKTTANAIDKITTNINDLTEMIGGIHLINSSVDKSVNINVQKNEYIGIKEFAWFINYDYLSCVITITNLNDEYAVEYPSFRITAYDSSGKVLGTSEEVMSVIYPKADFTTYCLLFAINQKPDRIDIVLLEPEEYSLIHKSILTAENYEKLLEKNVVVYADSVKGEIYNPNNYKIDCAMVTAIFRNENGEIVFAEQTFLNQLPATSSIPFDMYIFSGIDLPSDCEIVAVPW